MGVPPLTEEQLRQVVEARSKCGSNRAAADSLGLPVNTFKERLKRALRRGYGGTRPVLDGFEIKSTSAQIGPNGEIQREWIQQAPERGPEFELPAGHAVKGVSALVDADNRVVQQWIKTKEQQSIDDVRDAIKTVFDSYTGYAQLPPSPQYVDGELVTAYILADHHLGLYAWAQEAGEDYDLAIGERVLLETMLKLVSQAPASETAVILNLGDFFHADNSENRTAKSGNVLDVDTRYAKVLQIGVKLMVQCIELAKQKHKNVIVRCLPGNHDPHTAVALSIALSCFFAKDLSITIDCDASRFWWYQFGRVFLGATHGDMVRPEQMPGVMASKRPEDWGKSEFRYAYFGHVHHKSVGGGEQHGVIWETFQVLAAKDAWHAAKGFSSGRSMTAITHHKDYGEIMRHTVSIPSLRP